MRSLPVSSYPLCRGKRERTGLQAGFTLVELMVAMTGGLFVSIAVLALSRDASRFYQRETRAANATLASTTGFERLSNDIARAGHLVTPNITTDPRVCNRPAAGALLADLRAVTITGPADDLPGTEVANAGIEPMTIQVTGALEMIEELTTSVITTDGAGTSITLRLDTPAAARLQLVPGSTNDLNNQTILKSIFGSGATGRAVRIAQLDGLEQYALVSDVLTSPLRIILAATPTLQFRTSAVGTQCGILGFCTGCSINVVNLIRYQLRPMTGFAPYASLFQASGVGGTSNTLPFEAGRVELVREEIDPRDGLTAFTNTTEIVAEYAVDLQFGVTEATSATNPAFLAPAVPAGDLVATYPSTQLVRGIHARLAVRSREPDRQSDIAGATPGQYRFPLAGNPDWNEPGTPHARVRSLQADIPLRNLEGANW